MSPPTNPGSMPDYVEVPEWPDRLMVIVSRVVVAVIIDQGNNRRTLVHRFAGWLTAAQVEHCRRKQVEWDGGGQ
ncbi:MAG: hypothetical protein AAGD32_05205 [Planctomycetota bacterium]